MRIVFVGACDRVLHATKKLIKRGHEVIIIESDKEKVEHLSDELDCGLMLGDGSNPKVLQETKPQSVDFLFGFTNSDQNNILIGLVGKSIGFKEVVVVINDNSYEPICQELGLDNVFQPAQKAGNAIVNFIERGDTSEVRDYIKGDGELFKIVISEKFAGDLDGLSLPSNARPICFYRDGDFQFFNENTQLKHKDELVLLVKKSEIEGLEKKFNPEKPSQKKLH